MWRFRTLQVAALVLSGMVAQGGGEELARSAIFLKNWDLAGAEKYQVDGTTNLVAPSLVDEAEITAFRKMVAEANGGGRITIGRVPLDYRIRIFEEFAKARGVDLQKHTARTIEGEPIMRGNGNIFLCSNSPFVRGAMKKMVEACSEAGCDWISADLQTATHDSLKLGGCFCAHCEAGFARHLGKEADWSYGGFLRQRGYTTTKQLKHQAWQGEKSRMPFHRDYRAYQHKALRECYDFIRNEKKFLTSHDFHGHSAPLGTHVDFDRVGEAINRRNNARIPLLYKLGDAAGRMNLITEGPEGDWENFATARLRQCQAYAYGAIWVVPHEQGIRRGDEWKRVNPPVEDLYQFIRNNRGLLDGFEAWVSVGLVYSHLGHRHGIEASEAAVQKLVENNVPFRLCVAGSDWWMPEFDMDGVDALVTTADVGHLNPEQKGKIDGCGKPVFGIDSLEKLWEMMDRPVAVSAGNGMVNVVPRRKGGQRLLHLVNMEAGCVQREFVVRLSRQFAGEVRGATMYAPGRGKVSLVVEEKGRFIGIRVPVLKEWGIVVLR